MRQKVLTAQIINHIISECSKQAQKVYYWLVCHGLFPEKQKGCHKGKRGKDDLLYIDLHILKDSKEKRKNVAMAWMDNKKANYMILQS